MLAELLSYFSVNDSDLLPLLNSSLSPLGLFIVNLGVFALLGVEVDSVVVSIPLSERSSIDLDDTVLNQSFCSDQLVIGGVIDHVEYSGLAGDCF